MKKMKTLKMNFKKIIGLGIASIMTLAIIPLSGLINLIPKSTASASNNVTVSNSTFEEGVSGAEYSPTGWTAKSEVTDEDVFFIGGRFDATDENNFIYDRDSLVESWIDSHSKIENLDSIQNNLKSKLSYTEKKTGLTDNFILAMTSAYKVEPNTLTPVANTYTFYSPSFSVNAYTYYSASVFVKKTGNVSAKMSITGLSEDAKIIDITPTSDDWEEKTIYFTTKSASTVQFTLAIFNEDNNSGTVYYDNLQVNKLTYDEFYTSANNDNTAFNNRYDNENLVFNSPNNLEKTNTTEDEATITVDNGIKLEIAEDKTVSYKTTFTDNQKICSLKFYRLSTWIKTENSTSSFSITVTPQKEGINAKTLTVSSPTTGSFQEYVIYIRGNSYKDINFDLEFKFTKAGTHTLGYIVAELITADEYTNASGTKLALNTDDKSANITNGFFTSYISLNPNSTDYFPTSWTYVATGYKYMKDNTKPAEPTTIDVKNITLHDNKITYGGHDYIYNSTGNYYEYLNSDNNLTERIIKIDNMQFTYDAKEDSIFSSAYKCKVSNFSAKIENANNSMSNSTLLVNNNLVLNSDNSETTYMRSPEVTISSSTDYFISFALKLDENKQLNVKVLDDSLNELTTFTIIGNGAVQTYKLYIRGGSSTSKITLNFGINEDTGKAYLANVGRYSASTFDKVNKTSTSELVNTFILDLSNNNLKAFSYDGYANGIYKSTAIKLGSLDNVGTYGILDTLTASTYKSIYKDVLTAKDNDTDVKVIIIDNTSRDNNTNLSLKNAYTLSSSSYYMITIYAKTLSMEKDSTFNIRFTASNETETIDKQFSNIDTTSLTNEDTNGYQKYVLYVATSSEDFENFNVELNLNGKGTVLIDSVNVSSSSKSAFTSVTEDEFTITDNLTTTDNSSTTTKTSDTEKEEEPEKESNTLMIFFIVFSSIILVASILIALIYIGAKRLPHHKKAPKIKKPNPRQGKGFV